MAGGDLFWRTGLRFPVAAPFSFFHGRLIRRHATLQLVGRDPCAMDSLMFLVSSLNAFACRWLRHPLLFWSGGC
jgi:hypothetical protein